MGCGDDSDDSSAGTGGGGTGGKAGTGGKSGGGAGKAGSSGGGADPAACVTQTTDIMKGQSGLSAACISCICDQNAKAVVACNNNANCWPLISCVADKCTGNSDQVGCASTMCKDTFDGAGPAQGVAPALQGTACASKCLPAEGDAGVDAGN